MSHKSHLAVVSPELADCLSKLRMILEAQLHVIRALLFEIMQRSTDTALPTAVGRAASLIIQGASSSAATLCRLSESGAGLHTRDCFCIARSIVEGLINATYIMAEGEAAAEQAIRHAEQKAFRDLERKSNVGDSRIRCGYTGKPDPTDIKGLPKLLDDFTSQTGREKGWTNLSVDDRLQKIGDRFGSRILTLLHAARFMIYRHSSEIIHGTLFGCMFFFGHTQPRPPESMRASHETIGQHHMLVINSVIFAISGTIEAFHKAHGFAEGKKRSSDLLDEMSKIPYLSEDQAADKSGRGEGF